MNDSRSMSPIEAFGRLDSVLESLVDAIRFFDGVDSHDVRVVDGGGGLRLDALNSTWDICLRQSRVIHRDEWE